MAVVEKPVEIFVGLRMRVVILDKVGGKRTGQARPVKVIRLLLNKGRIRPGQSVQIVTEDDLGERIA